MAVRARCGAGHQIATSSTRRVSKSGMHGLGFASGMQQFNPHPHPQTEHTQNPYPYPPLKKKDLFDCQKKILFIGKTLFIPSFLLMCFYISHKKSSKKLKKIIMIDQYMICYFTNMYIQIHSNKNNKFNY